MKKLSPTQREAVEFLKEPNAYITACYTPDTLTLKTGFVQANIKVMDDAETPLDNMYYFMSCDGNYTNRHATINTATARCLSPLVELVEVLDDTIGFDGTKYGAFKLKEEFMDI